VVTIGHELLVGRVEEERGTSQKSDSRYRVAGISSVLHMFLLCMCVCVCVGGVMFVWK